MEGREQLQPKNEIAKQEEINVPQRPFNAEDRMKQIFSRENKDKVVELIGQALNGMTPEERREVFMETFKDIGRRPVKSKERKNEKPDEWEEFVKSINTD